MQEAAQSLAFFVLVIGIMLGGMNILASTSKPTKKAYDWMLKNLLTKPARKLLRYTGKQTQALLHYLWRQFRLLPLRWQLITGGAACALLFIAWVRASL